MGIPSVCFILIVDTLSSRHRVIGIVLSSIFLRLLNTVFIAVKHEQYYVTWTEQQTQTRKTGNAWSHLSFQLCVSVRRYMDCVRFTNPSWFRHIIHQSHQAALGVRGNLLQRQR